MVIVAGVVLGGIRISFNNVSADSEIPSKALGQLPTKYNELYRFSDREMGVTCYSVYSAWNGSPALSCVLTGANTQ